MDKPDCYKCKHQQASYWSCHSRCAHPHAPKTFGEAARGENKLGILVEAHGFMHGWAFWPEDFDPVWLLQCNGFEPKEEVSDGKAQG